MHNTEELVSGFFPSKRMDVLCNLSRYRWTLRSSLNSNDTSLDGVFQNSLVGAGYKTRNIVKLLAEIEHFSYVINVPGWKYFWVSGVFQHLSKINGSGVIGHYFEGAGVLICIQIAIMMRLFSSTSAQWIGHIDIVFLPYPNGRILSLT